MKTLKIKTFKDLKIHDDFYCIETHTHRVHKLRVVDITQTKFGQTIITYTNQGNSGMYVFWNYDWVCKAPHCTYYADKINNDKDYDTIYDVRR